MYRHSHSCFVEILEPNITTHKKQSDKPPLVHKFANIKLLQGEVYFKVSVLNSHGFYFMFSAGGQQFSQAGKAF